jgi:hypothetical protein
MLATERFTAGRIALVMIASLVSVAVHAQPGPPPVVRGGTSMATRPVAHYMALEQRLMESFQSKDDDTAWKLLADDFEVRFAERADSVAGTDWLRSIRTNHVDSFRVRNLSVHEFSDVDIVSFLLDQHDSAGSKTLPRTEFVVDVWSRDDRRLLTRYLAVPAHPLPASSRPDGR